MRIYRFLAYLLVAEVVVQAAAMAFGMAGLGHWVYDEGHTVTKATFEEGGPSFTGHAGFSFHGTNGALFIPILALAFLVVAWFTRRSVQDGLRWGAIVFVLVVVQVFLGFLTLESWSLGALHGANALLLFAAALHAARRRPTRAAAGEPVPADAAGRS